MCAGYVSQQCIYTSPHLIHQTLARLPLSFKRHPPTVVPQRAVFCYALQCTPVSTLFALSYKHLHHQGCTLTRSINNYTRMHLLPPLSTIPSQAQRPKPRRPPNRLQCQTSHIYHRLALLPNPNLTIFKQHLSQIYPARTHCLLGLSVYAQLKPNFQ